MKRILFQGDSVTDCGRSRENNSNVGDGYPVLIKSQLGYDFPNEYEFFNRGVSGNRVVDVYARIKADILNLKPDYMSILIGVNDVWHEVLFNNGISADKYEKIYSMLIEEIKQELPDTKIMILEPFCLNGSATENTEDIPDRWNIFNTEVKKRAERAKAVADKYGLPFVPLQKKFDEFAAKTSTGYLLADGVHPTAIGHELIAREWINAFKDLNR